MPCSFKFKFFTLQISGTSLMPGIGEACRAVDFKSGTKLLEIEKPAKAQGPARQSLRSPIERRSVGQSHDGSLHLSKIASAKDHVEVGFVADPAPGIAKYLKRWQNFKHDRGCFSRNSITFALQNFSKVMARVCQVTGKTPIGGNSVSHSNIKTKRRFLPNLQTKKFFLAEENKWITLKLSTDGIRTINKKGLYNVVKELRAQGQHI
jgi:large subunit ribosomal protein L28